MNLVMLDLSKMHRNTILLLLLLNKDNSADWSIEFPTFEAMPVKGNKIPTFSLFFWLILTLIVSILSYGWFWVELPVPVWGIFTVSQATTNNNKNKPN